MTDQHGTEAPADYDALLQANLLRVFGERDAARRIAAIRELYAEDAVLYEPQAAVAGHSAISEAVGALLSSLPPDFAFKATGPAVGHHGLARLLWQGGPAEGAVAVTGTDVACFKGNRIQTLHVLINPPA